MADAKKSTTPKKKTTSTKPKAATARKATTATLTSTPKKRPVVAKATTKTPVKQTPVKRPFMTMQPTRDTTYWLIFSLLILALGIWVLTLTIKINDIYDQIEANDSSLMLSTPTPHKHVDKAE